MFIERNTNYTRKLPQQYHNNNEIFQNNTGKFEGFQSKGYIDFEEFDNEKYSMFDISTENYLQKNKKNKDFDPFDIK